MYSSFEKLLLHHIRHFDNRDTLHKPAETQVFHHKIFFYHFHLNLLHTTTSLPDKNKVCRYKTSDIHTKPVYPIFFLLFPDCLLKSGKLQNLSYNKDTPDTPTIHQYHLLFCKYNLIHYYNISIFRFSHRPESQILPQNNSTNTINLDLIHIHFHCVSSHFCCNKIQAVHSPY